MTRLAGFLLMVVRQNPQKKEENQLKNEEIQNEETKPIYNTYIINNIIDF